MLTAAIQDLPKKSNESDTTNVPGDNKDMGDKSESKPSYVFVFIAVIVLILLIVLLTISIFGGIFAIEFNDPMYYIVYIIPILLLGICIHIIKNFGDVKPIFKVLLSLFVIVMISVIFFINYELNSLSGCRRPGAC